MTEPQPLSAEQQRERCYGIGSLIATLAEADGLPAIVLPPREASPAAHRAAVDAAVADTCAQLDAMLASKHIPPTRARVATLGRELVSNGEKHDLTHNTYTPGPGLAAMINAEAAAAANEKGQQR